MLRISLVAAAVVVGLAGLILLLLPGQRQEPGRFEVRQERPRLQQAAGGGEPQAPGSVMVFEAPFRSADGELTGIVSASLLAVEAPGEPGQQAAVELRLTDLVFHFDGKGSIVVAGGVDQPDDPAAGIAGAVPQTRQIVETTGAFAGFRGETVSTREADGSYTHDFTLRN